MVDSDVGEGKLEVLEMGAHSNVVAGRLWTGRPDSVAALAGLLATLSSGQLALADSVEFRIVQRSSLSAISPAHPTIELAVQAKVTGGGALGQFIVSPMVLNEPDTYGTFNYGRISATDGTYYTGAPQQVAAIGQGGLARHYSYFASLNGWFNGRFNADVPGVANTNGSQEINGVTGVAMGPALLRTPGVDADDDGNPDTWSGNGSGNEPPAGATATMSSTIMGAYFGRDQFVDVYRFQYTATNFQSARTLQFRFQTGRWAETFSSPLVYSVGIWKALTTGPATSISVSGLDIPLCTFDFGDLNHDCQVNCSDAIAAASAWGSTDVDPGYRLELDYDDDGDNDATDKQHFDDAYLANCAQTAPACGPGWITGMGAPTPAPMLVRAATRWSPMWSSAGGELVAKQLVIAYDYLDGANTRGAIARWDGASWTLLATGIVRSVDALAVNALPTPQEPSGAVYGNKLVAAGSFASIAGTSANNIAYFEGANWHPYHDPTGSGPAAGGMSGSGPVSVKALYTFLNTLYAGGSFTSADGVTVSNLAAWDGTSWSDVGGGTNSPVTALGDFGSRLFVGGSSSLTGAGGTTTVAGIASWDGTSWYALGTGITSGQVNCMVKYGSTGLAVGGSFTSAGGASSTSRIALWNNSGWSNLGSGLDDTVHCLASVSTTSSGLALVAGGDFAASATTPMLRIARWRSGAWESLGTGLAGVGSTVRAVVQLPNLLETIPCGVFSIGGSSTAQNLARWSDSGKPWIAVQPEKGACAATGGSVTMGATVASGYVPAASLQWEKLVSGTFAAISGQTSSSLHISPVQSPDYGSYRLRATGCGGDATSSTFTLGVTCPADQNQNCSLGVDDIFDFINDWFAGCIGEPPAGYDPSYVCHSTADVNHSLSVEIQDIFDFLNAWFAGCPIP